MPPCPTQHRAHARRDPTCRRAHPADGDIHGDRAARGWSTRRPWAVSAAPCIGAHHAGRGDSGGGGVGGGDGVAGGMQQQGRAEHPVQRSRRRVPLLPLPPWSIAKPKGTTHAVEPHAPASSSRRRSRARHHAHRRFASERGRGVVMGGDRGWRERLNTKRSIKYFLGNYISLENNSTFS